MSHAIERLETILSAWEDHWLLLKVLNQALDSRGYDPPYTAEGAVFNSDSFRLFLQGIEQNPNWLSGLVEFRPPWDISLSPTLVGLHAALATWCRSGRRGYVVSAAAQSRLRQVSLDGLSWVDIPFPFVSFAVALEMPVTSSRGDEYDLIMVGPYLTSAIVGEVTLPNFRVNEIRAFRRTVTNYQPLSEQQRKRLNRLLKERQFMKLAGRIDDLLGNIGKIASTTLILGSEAGANKVHVSDNTRKAGSVKAAVQEISDTVAQLCLYVTAHSEHCAWQQPFRAATGIHRHAHVCTLL